MSVKYVVHGGCVGCSMGSETTTLVGTTNSRIGSQIRMLKPNTGTDSFAGNFGICKTLTEQNNGIATICAMSNIPEWINTNSDFLSGSEHPCVTMNSFTICIEGVGVIVPLEDGQSMEDFDFNKFLEELPEDKKGLFAACAFGLDPVNMSTGNFIYSKDDIEIPGRFPLSFKRFYNAMDNSGGVLGKNWTHNFNIFLVEDGHNVKITFDDGHVEEYYRRDDGSYIAPLDHLNTLKQSKDGYTLTLPDMQSYLFDHQGHLLSISDLNGNTTALSYVGGLLKVVSSSCGSLSFTYEKKGKLIKVTDHTGRIASYEYSGEFLVAVTHPSGAVYRYEYGANGKISNIINPLGITAIHNEYDGQNRTVKQSFPDGGFGTMEYADQQLSTISTEQNGNQVIYVHDEDFRTTKIIYEDSVERFGYNKNNKRTLYVDRNGNARTYAYDDRGNLTKETDPMGSTTKTEYNEFNKPVKIVGPLGGITIFEYDPKGNIIKSSDPLDREIGFEHNNLGLVVKLTIPDASENTVEYDGRGNIIAIVDADDSKTQYEYDGLNRVIKTVNGSGFATLYEYNSNGDIIKVTNARGDTRRYEYNIAGKVTQITDFDGGIIEYKYNKLGKIEEIINQAGGSTRFTYDLMWNVTSVTDTLGNTVQYEYDKFQRVVRSIDEEGNATCYDHDPSGNVTATVSPVGARTEIQYDALDRQHVITEPDGAKTKFEYDKAGNLASVTDTLGNVTKREYDLAGQLTCLTDPLGNKTKFTYTALGQIESITDAEGGKQLYSYYPGGRLKSVILPCGESETYEYDKNGNVVKVTDALENETSLVYDCLDRVIEVINPLGHSKKFRYDALGNITFIMDEKNRRTQYKYSALGDVIEVIDANGHSTKYDYDGAGRLTKVEQYRLVDNTFAGVKCPEYQITTYERNKKGEVVAVKSPLGKIAKFGYDKVGNVVSKLDEDGLETLYEYNLVSKLTKVSYADGKTVEFGYNALKQLTAMQDWLGTTEIELDELGRTKKVTDFEGKEVCYSWNSLGKKDKIIYPDSREVKYEYTASGNIKKVLSESGVTNYTYDAMGRIMERILPESTTTKYELNQLGRLASLTHSRNDEILDQFKYTYDPVGNITQIDKNRIGVEADSGVFQYTYDPLDRLVAATHGDSIKRYRYDELGNRVSSCQNGETTTHSYNARNQLIKTLEGDAVKEYRYDGRGNLTAITENGLLKNEYAFDATNMMVKAFTAGKGKAEYAYNGFKDRVKKLERLHSIDTAMPDPCKEIRYVLDMTRPYDNLLMTQGAQNQSFIWGNSLLSASGEENFYYLQDHLGSPIRLFCDEQNNTALSYDEFGVPVVSVGKNENNPFGFTGYQVDDVSELYYAQARYYEPTTSKFVSKDNVFAIANVFPNSQIIANPFSFNQYLYCYNNPMIYIDADGNVPTWLKVVGGVAVVAGAVALTAVTFGAAAPLAVVATGAVVGTAVGVAADIGTQYVENGYSFDNYDIDRTIIAGVQGGLSGVIAATPIGAVGQGLWNASIGGIGSYMKGNDLLTILADAGIAGLVGYKGGPGIGRGSNLFDKHPIKELLIALAKAAAASNAMSLLYTAVKNGWEKMLCEIFNWPNKGANCVADS